MDESSRHVLTLVREYPHSREDVWEACITSEAMAQWFGPERAPATSFDADVRPMGRWRACLQVGEGKEPLYVSGYYISIHPPRRLVYSFRWEGSNHEDGPGVDTEVTMTFEALSAQRTRVTLHQTGLNSTKSTQGHQEGWESCMSRLGSWLLASTAQLH